MSESSIQGIHGSYLMPHFDHATVADAMHPGILSCEPDASLTEVARMMSTRHVHCIVIKAADDGPGDEPPLWGLVSDLPRRPWSSRSSRSSRLKRPRPCATRRS